MRCQHLVLKLHPSYKPYRYFCVQCQAYLKILSGVVLQKPVEN